MQQARFLNLRQDGSPTGQRQLAGSVHDSRVPTGTTPGQYLFNLSSEINSGRDTQQNSGSDVTEMNKEY
jgi:hypothetical protein